MGACIGQIHADLFLVKHLLVSYLMFCIFYLLWCNHSYFRSCSIRAIATKILREQLSPFDIQLRSIERQLDFSEAGKADSKRDLEDYLQSACNNFIEHTSSSLLGPIAGFVDQCKNTVVGLTAGLSAEALVLVKGVFANAPQSLDGELDNVSNT